MESCAWLNNSTVRVLDAATRTSTFYYIIPKGKKIFLQYKTAFGTKTY